MVGYLLFTGRFCQLTITAAVATLPAAVQSKVVAVAVFGDPYRTSGDTFPINSQSNVVGYCNTGDPICENGSNVNAHLTYGTDGSATKAAQFIAKRV